ncbi:MAG: ParB N-terminal domain-containing protein [Patescibacteria group bacterium]|nr:ParB N-terminal domain-containing protein [Patescibacteria group bacterium]
MQELLDKMEKRKDGGVSKEFITAFGNFVRAYERYLKWMRRVEKIQGQYHHEKSFSEYCKKNIDLIENIKKHGVKEPIVISQDKKGVDVKDGFHRLVIAKICEKTVKFSYLPTDLDG